MLNTITLQFKHYDLKQPQYCFGDRIAFVRECEPDSWPLGTVIGIQYQRYDWSWLYFVHFDSPLGLTDKCEEAELVLECVVPLHQASWEFQSRLAELPY